MIVIKVGPPVLGASSSSGHSLQGPETGNDAPDLRRQAHAEPVRWGRAALAFRA
jgi:hypothetical protein